MYKKNFEKVLRELEKIQLENLEIKCDIYKLRIEKLKELREEDFNILKDIQEERNCLKNSILFYQLKIKDLKNKIYDLETK